MANKSLNSNISFFEYGGRNYGLFKKETTFAHAKSIAKKAGGYLAEIGSREENQAVFQAIQSALTPQELRQTRSANGGGAAYVWLGGSDASQEGFWSWSASNSLLAKDNPNWGQGETNGQVSFEPDNFMGNQNSLALGLENWPLGSADGSGKGTAGSWNDLKSTEKLYSLIEFDSPKKSPTGSQVEPPRNVIVFIRDQVKPEDLWLPRDWAKDNLPNQQWLKDNGLSFTNACTNTAMCTAARATFFTSKFPAQHEVGLVLSDIKNPILDAQTQLSPDLPNLATVLKGQGYDVGFIGKAHLSKTFTRNDGEIVYQDLKAYGFDDWQGPDAGQDMEIQNAGGGYANHDRAYTQQAVDWITNRAASGSTKPFCLVVSLINPHDVLSYPKTYKDFGYDDSWLQGDLKDLPPTVNEILAKNYKPSVQTQWSILQALGQPMKTDQEKLEYLNFYGNLLKDVDGKMGQILGALGKTNDPADYSELLKDTLIVSTADHGEMGLSHGGLVQKMEVAYDEALKVPMVWSNPEYFKGAQSTDALVSHVDFLPTLVNFLGFDPSYIKSQDLRGVDYSKILNYAHIRKNMSRAPEAQSSVLFTFDDIYSGQDPRLSINGNYVHGLFPAANRIQALRTKNFKYARYYSGDKAYTPVNWQGEFYDLRKNGGDYYPDKNLRTGKPNIFKGGPLEMKNLDPKADAQRVLDGKKSLATSAQKIAYTEMFNMLDQQIDERLDPLTGQPAIAPDVFIYQGGSMEGSVYRNGDYVRRLIPAQSGQNLELAFNTRAHQTYNIVYRNSDSSYASLVSNIAGTNGPVYQYLTGLPSSLSLDDISIEWVGGYVPLA